MDEDKKIQKYERTGVTKVKFIAHHKNAACKYILECYGITKDVTTDGFVMVLPFGEHGNLRAFLKMNENTLTSSYCCLNELCTISFYNNSNNNNNSNKMI
ncbi:hypothetical protein G9A89_002604 [Geosiphon pyriformis]|nr:hypothetical protein G9A89_002604 [Geosiphon pyriformis]